jgi:hypothetical protein
MLQTRFIAAIPYTVTPACFYIIGWPTIRDMVKGNEPISGSAFAGIVRLGFITDLLSKPILVGYIAGSTLIVIASQLGKLFGISLENRDFLPQLWELITRLNETHWLTFTLQPME